MDHEYKVHHITSQLLTLLQLQHLQGLEAHTDTLLQHMTPYVSTQVSIHTALRKIGENTSKKEEFLKKYEELKVQQARELDPLVYLLSRMVDDKPLCEFLRERRPLQMPKQKRVQASLHQIDLPEGVPIPELPPKGTKLTPGQVQALKGQLSMLTTSMDEAAKKKKHRKGHPEGDYPEIPSWVSEREHLSLDYMCAQPRVEVMPRVTIGSLPLPAQQYAVMDDLLNLMLGVDGRYITAKPLKDGNSRSFTVDLTLNTSLLSLVNRILPLCSHYSTICRFMEENSKFVYGQVNQGLAAAMRQLVREHSIVVAQLETQLNQNQLTLQKMWYYLQPCLKTMELLARTASTVEKGNCRGGKTLTVLHKLTASLLGDDRAEELSLHITREASKPFMEMLSLWIHEGKVVDPYAEFMITENEEIKRDRLHDEYNDDYWERRYFVCQENVPLFLEVTAKRVLDTGKYLNVVRSCGREVEGIKEGELMGYSLQESHYLDRIDQAYARASHELLVMMLTEHDLMGHLRSIKHFFLLDQGDMLVHFMDSAEEELTLPIGVISLSRLETLLEVAVRTSVSNGDPYKDNLRLLLKPYNLKTHLIHVLAVQPEVMEYGLDPRPVTRPPSSTSLPSFEGLCFDYRVQWPLSLILSRKRVTHYQLLFRHLFLCKYVERQLSEAWKCHKNTLRGPCGIHIA